MHLKYKNIDGDYLALERGHDSKLYKGVSTEFIQESFGHTRMKTTESYLDSFEKSVKKEYSRRFVAFKEGVEK